MIDRFNSRFSKILNRFPANSIYLLALSGGPDSLALFHLLMNYKQKHLFNFAIAHINHNWRPESSDEAKQLGTLAKKNDIPFYLKEIFPDQLKGNLESASRDERLNFYRELCLKHGYQAVLLGHHKDDQAETVLKRVLEGASLNRLHGLQEISLVNEVNLCRPLLPFTKAEILDYIQKNSLKPFIDSTNNDPKYLRAKFRTRIIPELSATFGKNVSNNLCHLADEASELREFMLSNMQSYLESIERNSQGLFLDLSKNSPKHSFEIKFLIREFLKQENLVISKSSLKLAVQMFIDNDANRYISIEGSELYIDRRRLFLFKKNPEVTIPALANIQEGQFQYGSWKVNITKHFEKQENKIGWKNVWDGEVDVCLPEGNYVLRQPKISHAFPGNSSLNKWWNDHKVPAFLRHDIPVIWQDGRIIHEFLTHRGNIMHNAATQSWLHISFTR